MIAIKMVSNGWVLEDKTDDEFVRVTVFEHGDSEKSEVETFIRLLWAVNDIMGPSTSRYSENRVSVSSVRGDKCDDHLEGEES